jgi:hypothetical protein
MYDKFLSSKATSMVNVTAAARNQTEQQLNIPTKHLFVQAQEQVTKLDLTLDCLASKTNQFQFHVFVKDI